MKNLSIFEPYIQKLYEYKNILMTLTISINQTFKRLFILLYHEARCKNFSVSGASLRRDFSMTPVGRCFCLRVMITAMQNLALKTVSIQCTWTEMRYTKHAAK